MAQFDLYSLDKLLVVDLQSDVIGIDYSRVVAPLRRSDQYQYLPRLTPRVTFNDEDFVVHVHDLATIPAKRLGKPVGRLENAADELLRALDILTRGF